MYSDQMNISVSYTHLYNNQVFVADNIKEIIPEFLFLLKGIIDCPDVPLNVSRSFLQNDGTVKKISDHIVKKVADRLSSLYNTDIQKFHQCWDDISPFVKYGCIRDDKFYTKIKDILTVKTIDNKYCTLEEYGKRNKTCLLYTSQSRAARLKRRRSVTMWKQWSLR